jgi:hypothetical protein
VDHSRRRRVVAGVAGVVLLLLLGGTWGVTRLDDHLVADRVADGRRVVPAATRGDCAAATAAYRGATTGPLLPGRERPPVPADAARLAGECRAVLRGRRPRRGRPAGPGPGGLPRVPAHARLLPALRTGPPPHPGRRPRPVAAPATVATCRLVALAVGHDNLPDPVDASPALLTTCGEQLRTTADGDAAFLLSTVRTRHPGSPEAARAAAAEAELLVGNAVVADTNRTPHRIRPGSGDATVVVTNATRTMLRLAISGPAGGRVVEIAPCALCRNLDPAGNETRCEPGAGVRATISLPPGTYRVLAYQPIGGRVDSWTGRWRLRPGRYAGCLARLGG